MSNWKEHYAGLSRISIGGLQLSVDVRQSILDDDDTSASESEWRKYKYLLAETKVPSLEISIPGPQELPIPGPYEIREEGIEHISIAENNEGITIELPPLNDEFDSESPQGVTEFTALTYSAHQPPGLAEAIVVLFGPKRRVDAILGDLAERFNEELTEKGLKRARLLFWARVVRSIGPLLWPRFARQAFLSRSTKSAGV